MKYSKYHPSRGVNEGTQAWEDGRTCYMGVYFDKASKYDQALKELLKIDNITGMDFTTGKSSLFCKIRAIDSNDARQIISKIHKIEGINRTETFFSLEQLLNQKESLLSTITF